MSTFFNHGEILCERTSRKRVTDPHVIDDERQCDARVIVKRLARKPVSRRVKH